MKSLDTYFPEELAQKREKHFSTLTSQQADALSAWENAEQVAKAFDEIFLKLLRLIKYSTNKNNTAKSEIENQTDNLLRKLSKFLRQKPLDEKVQLDEKMKYEQKAFFEDICTFVNQFVINKDLSDVHNSIPRTSLQDFSKKSVWNQLFQNMYARDWWMEWSAEWWSCSYWTILLYNFFNKLKEAWLDLNITFFRYKNLDDNILWDFETLRHSWLVVNFQWEDYMVDHDWLIYDDELSIVRPLSTYINNAHISHNPKERDFFESFKNKKDTNLTKFFDNKDEFIQHCQEYPEKYKLSLYVKSPDKEKAEKINFIFWKHNFRLEIDGTMHEFYLKDNKLQFNNFTKNLIKNVFTKRVGNKFIPVTEQDREMLRKYFGFVKSKINTDTLYKHYTSWGERKVEELNFNGATRLIYWNIIY